MGKYYALQDTHFLWCLWNIILYNIIFLLKFLLAHLYAIVVPICWHSCQYVSLMADGIANFFMLVVTDVIVTVCKRYGIQVHFKSGKTIKDELVAPKDKEHITKKSGIIYRFKCDVLGWNAMRST